MTDLEIANMLADYHKECEAAETLKEKGKVQLKHARLIREALQQPILSKPVCVHYNYRAGHSPFVPCICNDCGQEI